MCATTDLPPLTSLSVYCPARGRKTQSVNGSKVLKKRWVGAPYAHLQLAWSYFVAILCCKLQYNSPEYARFSKKICDVMINATYFLFFVRHLALNYL